MMGDNGSPATQYVPYALSMGIHACALLLSWPRTGFRALIELGDQAGPCILLQLCVSLWPLTSRHYVLY